MDKRVLYGCLAALGLLLGADLLASVSGWKLDAPVRTGLGIVYAGDVLLTFAAMALGGWVARRDFRWIAVALTALLWVAVVVLMQVIGSPGGPAPTPPLIGIIKFNALSIGLGLVVSWLGAALGERLATRSRAAAV